MPYLNDSPNADCFALLDDCTATEAEPRSRLYTGYAGSFLCPSPAALQAALEEMNSMLQQGRHAVGLFSYELGEQMHGIVQREEWSAPSRILLFEQCQHLSAAQVESWLAKQAERTPGMPAGVIQVAADTDSRQFAAAIERIQEWIAAGDTYQVNFTYRLHFHAYGPLAGLYLKLRTRQPVPYGALLALPDGSAVLSLSPELFVRKQNGLLTAQPMKGTAAATEDPGRDTERAAALAADSKNRAENLMIVDLLRNDLGRVAEPGSVKVPRLFEVSRYSSVLQMTSTVQARLRKEIRLADLFASIYPCGSITGAPKRRTMQIIRELETAPRGYYTGAIGWFEAPTDDQHMGDFCLSVPIRTLQLQLPAEDGLRAGTLGIGAGITFDSNAQDEYLECQLKAQFLTGMPHDFELFETIYATAEGGCRHLERHLHRLQASASFFGFDWDNKKIRAEIFEAIGKLSPGTEYRLRLGLGYAGSCSIQTAPLKPVTTPVRLLRTAQQTDGNDVFLRHKTSVRRHYDAAWRAAEVQGAFDALFCNRRGELTEGGRSNVFVRLEGRWYTPPLKSGVLPGIMRSVLLADPAWNASERTLTWTDLLAAEQIVVCNALRGALPAVIDWDVPPLNVLP